MRMFMKFSGFIYDREDFNLIIFELFCSTTCALIILNDGNEWALYPGIMLYDYPIKSFLNKQCLGEK